MRQLLAITALLQGCISMWAQTKNNEMKYNKIQVEDCRVFYREAGNPEKPTILLLHGFPSSSHMFRELMPELADDFHLIAPDFPAFGQTESPDREHFTYSFDHLARIVDKFTEAIGLTKFAMYVFDYGAPIGYRLAMWHPERITAIISQNGNMYEEGLGKKWEARKAYWKNPTDELRQQFASAYALETIIGQYTFGTPEGSVGPDGYSLDYYYNTSVPISPHCWLSGERTTLHSSLKVPKPSSATCLMPKSISYPADISHLKAITRRLPN